jgi:hypothetical protein
MARGGRAAQTSEGVSVVKDSVPLPKRTIPVGVPAPKRGLSWNLFSGRFCLCFRGRTSYAPGSGLPHCHEDRANPDARRDRAIAGSGQRQCRFGCRSWRTTAGASAPQRRLGIARRRKDAGVGHSQRTTAPQIPERERVDDLATAARPGSGGATHLRVRTNGQRGGGNASHRHGGAGVAKDVRDKTFKPIFRTKGTGIGSGLGLGQVLGFAKQSGGVRI